MGLQDLNLSKGYAFFVKNNFHTRFHQHYGIKLIFCPERFFEIEIKRQCYRLKAVITPSNLFHRFRCFKTCKILYVNPLSSLGGYIVQRYHLASLPIEKLSEISFLSESCSAHLFKEQISVSIKQYILWNKVRKAVAYSREENLTCSAYFAGFSDSAHFIRVFAKMFGSSPFFALKA